jgi:predicted transcriptional regulator
VIDGPFTETKELVAGFWIWNVKSLDEAIEWAKRCPNPMPGDEGVLEIRPFHEMEDFAELLTDEHRERAARLRKQKPKAKTKTAKRKSARAKSKK